MLLLEIYGNLQVDADKVDMNYSMFFYKLNDIDDKLKIDSLEKLSINEIISYF